MLKRRLLLAPAATLVLIASFLSAPDATATTNSLTVPRRTCGPSGGRVVASGTPRCPSIFRQNTPPAPSPPAAVPGRWAPSAAVSWQWELTHPLDLANPADMGTGVSTYQGTPAPDPTVYDIDGLQNPASTVAALHAAGDRVVCYIPVGAAELYRPDFAAFPASSLGAPVAGYPNERYLNINDPNVPRIIEDRISMCASKGFDAVEPDIDDSYASPTGFAISQGDNVAFDTTLANYAHSLGLAWTLKNGDDPAFAAAMQAVSDLVVDEQCFEFQTCSAFNPFVAAGKPVLQVEYNLPATSFCPQANRLNFSSQILGVELSGGRQPCR